MPRPLTAWFAFAALLLLSSTAAPLAGQDLRGSPPPLDTGAFEAAVRTPSAELASSAALVGVETRLGNLSSTANARVAEAMEADLRRRAG